MKLSLEWIQDFVDLSGIDADTIADRLTMATAEIESIDILERTVDDVVVAEVVSISPFSESESNNAPSGKLVTVDIGEERPVITVCTAPNVSIGMKTAFAPSGAHIAGGKEVGTREFGDVKSVGLLLSAREAGLSDWHEGILDLPNLPNGTRLADHISAKDTILDVDNKSLTHRPDLWGHYGFARELAALFGCRLRPLPMLGLDQYANLQAVSIHVADFEACPCYSATRFKIKNNQPSPLTMQSRLHAIGQRTHSLLVDVSNFVLYELGQPTHMFDGDTISELRIDFFDGYKPFETLDGVKRDMKSQDLMIYNEVEPVAIAGVMGGAGHSIRSETTRVLLESANFRGSLTRRSSIRLGLRSEASLRFEKNLPPLYVKHAAARILQLIDDAEAGLSVMSRFTVAGDLREERRYITIPAGYLKTFSGPSLDEDRIQPILKSLDFECEERSDGSLSVGVPPHRSVQDISLVPDLAEEVLRVFGYDQIEPLLPTIQFNDLQHRHRPLQLEHRVRRLLALSHNFREALTYSWMDERWLSDLSYNPSTLSIANPPTQFENRLRPSLVPNLLLAVQRNCQHRASFRIFEIGSVFTGTDESVDLGETARLAGVSYFHAPDNSSEKHFLSVKSAVEDIAAISQIAPFRFRLANDAVLPWEESERFLDVLSNDGKTIGHLGLLGGGISRVVAGTGEVIWFELEMDALDGPLHPHVLYQTPNRYPGSWQDFSIIWERTRGFARLEGILEEFSHPLLQSREFLFLWFGKGLPTGCGSYTFRFTISHPEKTLTGDELDGFHQAFMEFMGRKGLALRS